MAAEKSGKKATVSNLKILTPEQAREYGKKGGEMSAQSYKRRKAFKEVFATLLDMKVTPEQAKKLDRIVQEINKDISVAEAIAIAQVHKAIRGDTPAAIFVRDTVGDKPTDRVEQQIIGVSKFFLSDNEQAK